MRRSERVAWAAVGFLMATTIMAMGTAREPGDVRDVVRARCFEVVNLDGRVVVQIGFEKKTKSGQLIMNEGKTGNLYLATGTQEGSGFLWLTQNDNLRICLDSDGDGNGQAEFYDGNGKPIHKVPGKR